MEDRVRILEKIEIVADIYGKRLDLFLFERLGRSRSYFKNLIADGLVTVNGKVCKASYSVKTSDVISVSIPDESIDLTPKEIDFSIVYDSKWYAVVDKPAGVVVHPAPGNTTDTLVNGILARFEIKDDEVLRPGIVHRLDKDTSGLILVAKNRDVRQRLSEIFQQREIVKVYLAICLGKPKKDYIRVENFIGRSPSDRKRMAVVDKNGKLAVSEVYVLKRFKEIFLAAIRIYTGRTHQIRVHLSHLGYPIIGDSVYGGSKVMKYGIERQALHSYYLKFFDPYLEKDVFYKSDLPLDMMSLLLKYGFDSGRDYLNPIEAVRI
ncbi:MAG: RluA family pseudouridine synthase [Calditerrivibrio sp.]|nr:RluA family pseudouridine synthase [Calditerrivibrio sp.]